MRIENEIKDQRKYFGFYSRLYPDEGECELFDRAYDIALKGSGRRQVSNRQLMKVLLQTFVEVEGPRLQAE